MSIPWCDICYERQAEGQLVYMDGEIIVGCGDCLLDIAKDSAKPVESIYEYDEYELSEMKGQDV